MAETKALLSTSDTIALLSPLVEKGLVGTDLEFSALSCLDSVLLSFVELFGDLDSEVFFFFFFCVEVQCQ